MTLRPTLAGIPFQVFLKTSVWSVVCELSCQYYNQCHRHFLLNSQYFLFFPAEALLAPKISCHSDWKLTSNFSFLWISWIFEDIRNYLMRLCLVTFLPMSPNFGRLLFALLSWLELSKLYLLKMLNIFIDTLPSSSDDSSSLSPITNLLSETSLVLELLFAY